MNSANRRSLARHAFFERFKIERFKEVGATAFWLAYRATRGAPVVLSIVVLAFSNLAFAQDQAMSEAPMPGIVTGTVVDPSGAVIAHAQITLTQPNRSPNPTVESGQDGQFSFGDVLPGSFEITVSAANFTAQTVSGTLPPGQVYVVPPVQLSIASDITVVRVEPGPDPVEVAEIQIHEEEKQHVLAVIPNFYVTYVSDAVSLNMRQKFQLAWKTTIDPFSFLIVAGSAGIEQASDQFGGYGQGAEGYAKRYGASYADFVSGTFIAGAILPSLLKQDPRYFYKGTGTKRERLLYAIANAVICKGDNKKWQPNYSNILGGIASGGISNLYYPPNDRNWASLTFENAAIGIGAAAAENVIQEFIVRKLTPNLPKHNSSGE